MKLSAEAIEAINKTQRSLSVSQLEIRRGDPLLQASGQHPCT